MKKNSSKSRYGSLSSLKELEYEKQLLQYKIKYKEKEIKRDWNIIYDKWNFIPNTLNTLRSIIEYIPVGVSVISQIINSFWKNKKDHS
jgi:hypothetical protein